MKKLIIASLFCALAAATRESSAFDSKPVVVAASGTVEPREMADVVAEVSGNRIKEFGVDPQDSSQRIDYGSRVTKGTVLARLDSTVDVLIVQGAKAKLAHAIANLDVTKARAVMAEGELKRQAELEKAGRPARDVDDAKAAFDIARAKVRAAEAEIEGAKAELQIAQVNLARCTIRAPIDGIVIDRRASVGQPVSANQTLFLIAGEPTKYQVWAVVNEADIARIAKGQPVRFTVGALPHKSFTGHVSQIRLNAAQIKDTVVYTVVIDVDGGKDLLPYLTAHVEIETTRQQ